MLAAIGAEENADRFHPQKFGWENVVVQSVAHHDRFLWLDTHPIEDHAKEEEARFGNAHGIRNFSPHEILEETGFL